jgi:hypothetical protein
MLDIVLDVFAPANAVKSRDQADGVIGFDHFLCPSIKACWDGTARLAKAGAVNITGAVCSIAANEPTTNES